MANILKRRQSPKMAVNLADGFILTFALFGRMSTPIGIRHSSVPWESNMLVHQAKHCRKLQTSLDAELVEWNARIGAALDVAAEKKAAAAKAAQLGIPSTEP
jgi:hypothetical protein